MARMMKDSGIEWIGEIPETWKRDKIVRVFELIGSGTTPKSTDEEQYGGTVNWIQSGDINGSVMSSCKNTITEQTLQAYSTLKVYQAPFIILAMYGASVGNLSISTIDGCVNQACCVLSMSKCDFQYAFYTLKAAKDYLLQKAVGGGQPNISQDIIRSLWIPQPELEEQHRIADFLDRKCAEIDAVIERTKATIEEYKKLKQAVITEAVTKGVRGPRSMKNSGIEWIGEIPEKWTVCCLKRFCTLKTGTTPSTTNAEWFDGNVDWFTPGDFADSYVLTHSKRTLSQQAKDDGVATIIPSDTVLIVGIGATAGKIGLASNECSCNQQITAIIAPKIASRYLMYWMIANTTFLRETALYTTLPILNNETIGEYLFVVPDTRVEQLEIAVYLDEKCIALDTLIAKKTALLTELEIYKKSLIYEYVTGKKEVGA